MLLVVQAIPYGIEVFITTGSRDLSELLILSLAASPALFTFACRRAGWRYVARASICKIGACLATKFLGRYTEGSPAGLRFFRLDARSICTLGAMHHLHQARNLLQEH